MKNQTGMSGGGQRCTPVGIGEVGVKKTYLRNRRIKYDANQPINIDTPSKMMRRARADFSSRHQGWQTSVSVVIHFGSRAAAGVTGMS